MNKLNLFGSIYSFFIWFSFNPFTPQLLYFMNENSKYSLSVVLFSFNTLV